MRFKEAVTRMRTDMHQLSRSVTHLTDDAVELLRSEEVRKLKQEAAKLALLQMEKARRSAEKLLGPKIDSLDQFVSLAASSGAKHIQVTPSVRIIGNPNKHGFQPTEYYTQYRTADLGTKPLSWEEIHFRTLINNRDRNSLISGVLSLRNLITADSRLIELRGRIPDAVLSLGINMSDSRHHELLDRAKRQNVSPFPRTRTG